MPTGYPTDPETAPPSLTHGWPVPDQSDGWTTTLYRESEPRGTYVAARWAKSGVDMSGTTQVLGSALGKYDPGRLLGYVRALHRYLLLLDALTYRWGKPAREFNSWDYPLGNFADQWTFRCTGASGATLTLANSYAGCDDPRRVPVTGASGLGTTYSRLQPWDVIKTPGASNGPWGIVTDVTYGETSTTVTLHKALSLSTPVTIGAEGDRCEPPLLDYPEPYTVAGRCANCRIDPTGAMASGHVTGLYTASDPEYYGAPAATYLDTYWYCAAMETASLVSGFTAGTCAQTGCSGYSAATAWPPMPAGVWGRIWQAANVALVWDPLLSTPRYLAERIGMPSLRQLCGAVKTLDSLGEQYSRQGAVSAKEIVWPGTGVWGTLSEDSSHTWRSGIFREDGTGILDGAPARASWTGGTTVSETDAGTGTDRYRSLGCHPARRLPSVALNSYQATPGAPSEYFVQRRRRRTIALTGLTKNNVALVEHTRATTQFHGAPGKTVTASFTSGLTIQLERDRSATKSTVSERAQAVYSATVEDGCLRVEFYPEAVTLGYVTLGGSPPRPVDTTKQVLAAGGTVDAPYWSRCTNTSAGADRCKVGCVYDKIQVGDALTFDSAPEYSFAVVRAEAHYGTTFSGTVDGVSSTEEPTAGIFTWLSADVSDSATTLPVANATRFPDSGQVQIGSEEITYSARTATSFTGCGRGANATAAAAHNDGDAVYEDSGATDALLMGVPSNWGGASPVRLKMDTVWLDWSGELGASALTAEGLPAQGDVVTVTTGPVFAPQRVQGAGGAIESSGYGSFPAVARYVGGVPSALTAGTDYLVDRATGVIEVAYSVVSAWPAGVGDITVDGWFLEAPNDVQAELLAETRAALRRIDGALVSSEIDCVSLRAVWTSATGSGNTTLPRWDLLGNWDNGVTGVTVQEFSGTSMVAGISGLIAASEEGDPTFPRIATADHDYATPAAKIQVFAPVHGMRSDWIQAAYLDVYFSVGIEEIRRYSELGSPTTIVYQGAADLSASLLVTDSSGNLRFSSGGSTAVRSAAGWQTINVTEALRALADADIGTGGVAYLAISGPWDEDLSSGTVTSLDALANPFLGSLSWAATNGVLSAFSATYTYYYATGLTMAARNLRLTIDWDAIEASDLPDFPYDNWPGHGA